MRLNCADPRVQVQGGSRGVWCWLEYLPRPGSGRADVFIYLRMMESDHSSVSVHNIMPGLEAPL